MAVDQESPAPHARSRADSPEAAAERTLLARLRKSGRTGISHDKAAWSELVTRYQDRLYSVCLRMVTNREAAADCTQEAFLKIIQNFETYDARAGAGLLTWMTRIAINTCLSHLRSQKYRRHASLDAKHNPQTDAGQWVMDQPESGLGLPQSRELSPDSGVQMDDRRRFVAAALDALPPDSRAILVLRDVQELEYDQIALVLDLPVGTVKSRLFRARIALRELVEKQEKTRGGTSR